MNERELFGIRRHFSYANVIATIALFLAIGGGGFALAALKKNSVKSKQIASDAVKTPEIAANAVKGAELAEGAVTSPKVGPDAITGENANESTFGEVPSAANSNQLGGIGASGFLQTADVQAFGAASTTNVVGFANAGFTSMASKSFTLNQAGFALVNGSITAAGATAGVDKLKFRLSVDGTAVTNDDLMNQVSSDQFEGNTGATTVVVPISAGNHTVSLDAAINGDDVLDIFGSSISILIVPNGSAPSIPF